VEELQGVWSVEWGEEENYKESGKSTVIPSAARDLLLL
jgi:hypothetical protein